MTNSTLITPKKETLQCLMAFARIYEPQQKRAAKSSVVSASIRKLN